MFTLSRRDLPISAVCWFTWMLNTEDNRQPPSHANSCRISPGARNRVNHRWLPNLSQFHQQMKEIFHECIRSKGFIWDGCFHHSKECSLDIGLVLFLLCIYCLINTKSIKEQRKCRNEKVMESKNFVRRFQNLSWHFCPLVLRGLALFGQTIDFLQNQSSCEGFSSDIGQKGKAG